MRPEPDRIASRIVLWFGLIAAAGILLLVLAVPRAACRASGNSPALQAPVAPAPPSAEAQTETLDLCGTWMFRADWNEDGLAQGWQNPGVDESHWRAITVPGPWEDQGVTKSNPLWPSQNEQDGYNGYAWYRRAVAVPKEWNTDRLLLRIGKIDGRDWAYVNGRQVGATTNEEEVDQERRYRIPAEVIKPGESNLIAVRVCDGGGLGGIVAGPVELVRDGEAALAPAHPPDAVASGEEKRFLNIWTTQTQVGDGIEVPRDTKVEGDAVAVGGPVTVLGWVTGDAVAVGGNLRIGPEGRVDGDAVAVGGAMVRDPGAHIGGQQVCVGGSMGNLAANLVERLSGARTAPISRPHEHGFWGRFLVLLAFGAAVSVLPVLLFPRRMTLMANALLPDAGRAAAAGVVGIVLAPGAAVGLLIVAAIAAVVSAVTIIGPLVVLAALAAIYVVCAAAVAMGCGAISLSLGKAVLDRRGGSSAHPAVAALGGAVILALAETLPVVGVLVAITVITFGCGLALMTGAGKHERWLSLRGRRGGKEPRGGDALMPVEQPTLSASATPGEGAGRQQEDERESPAQPGAAAPPSAPQSPSQQAPRDAGEAI